MLVNLDMSFWICYLFGYILMCFMVFLDVIAIIARKKLERIEQLKQNEEDLSLRHRNVAIRLGFGAIWIKIKRIIIYRPEVHGVVV